MGLRTTQEKLPGGGAGITDGDKGDITVTGTGATWTIDNDSVTYAKIQNVSATNRILGRITAAAGDVEELTAANVFTILGVTASAAELNHNVGVTSAVQTQLDAKQPLDTQLTSLAALAYTGNGTKVVRVNAGENGFELATISSGSGITRAVVVTTGNVTAGATASADYVYLVSGLHTVTLPTAVSNTNLYTIKNNHSAAITVSTTLSQTIDGTTSIQIAPEDSVDVISTNANWSVI